MKKAEGKRQKAEVGDAQSPRAASLLLSAFCLLLCSGAAYENPVIFADYSDPDVIRSGDDFFLVASSFDNVPALPILHSRDLVHWTIATYAASRLPSPDFDRPQPGNGVWAPSIRQHGGWFWIYFGDPDRGIYMTRARDPRGPWSPLKLIKEAKGWIDPCPLWDDDGSMYLVHAWAKSRAGFNNVLTVNRMSADGMRVLDQGALVFDGRERHTTVEGPKFYKRNGWYYIFAPAGGVKTGYQLALRSRNVFGPYEDKVVLEQRNTTINGPHQGAWVDAPDGSNWFLHFQDRGAWGRVVLLEPMQWINDWPEIGRDGRPVASGETPFAVRSSPFAEASPWQWLVNPQPGWAKFQDSKIRLRTTNALLQKFVGPSFRATVKVVPQGRAGLVVMGETEETIAIEKKDGVRWLRVDVTPQAVCRFSSSTDGKTFTPTGKAFIARPGRWIGAKVGIFGFGDFEDFRIEPLHVDETATFTVAQDGGGDFTTIQQALDALPPDDTSYRTILIRNGIYKEKVMITASHVALVGEDREKTRIEVAELRKNWRATHPDDWGAAVININATDVILANLTVRNPYGATNGDHDHQFAIRSMDDANRIAILSANVIADGGDTLSLWNVESGLSYYADSYFEGYVDYLCPRGWAYVTNSRFFGHNLNASIWHDGSRHKEQKFVVRHSTFDGVPGFVLGRNHRDAQFYLIDDTFSAAMADRAIYPSPAPDPRKWGERYYYANDHREGGGEFAWYADNLRTAAGSPRDEDITAAWAFDGQWDPASLPPLLPFAAIPNPENGWRWVDPAGVTLRWTPARNAKTQRVFFGTTNPPVLQREQSSNSFATGVLIPGETYYWRIDDGPVWSFRTDPRTVRIALAGDSTMTDKSGYGIGLKALLDDSAAFYNGARGGRSSKSFANEGHWQELLRHRPTHILIQFGHNDVKGKGADRETDLPTFRAFLERYVDEARAAGAMPILVTPLTRRYFRADAKIHSDLNDYAEQTRAVAAEKGVKLVDLHNKSIELLETLGPSAAIAISPLKVDFTIDKTHLNAQGSALIGALVAHELHAFVPQFAQAGLPVLQIPWSVRMADSVMKRTPNPLLLDVPGDTPKWDYTQGLVLLAIQQLAQRTDDERYANYVKAFYDGMIDNEGHIRAYKMDEYSLDRINAGKTLFGLKGEKYRKAIENLREQFKGQPRNPDSGFWHKKRYPHQMWLDGLYMGVPFLAQYAKVYDEPADFDEVITQFVLMEKHARDEKSGLLVHGYDDARAQKWADPQTGKSPTMWGRAMGWYAMGLVEALDYIPLDHPRRPELIAILQRFADAIVRVQDPKTGTWWQVVDQPGREKNYLESSASAMFTFVLLKSSRLGYIDPKYAAIGRRAYQGLLDTLVTTDPDGSISINQAVAVVGLGGDPNAEGRYRDGTYDYYVTEKTRSNDPKAVGPFIFASLEMER